MFDPIRDNLTGTFQTLLINFQTTTGNNPLTTNPSQIYDLRLKRYKCELEEDHPSLDGCVKKARVQPGADIASQELDLFNLKYQRLCESLQSRIKEIGDQHPDDPELQVGAANCKGDLELYNLAAS